jgi:hypothetical protein
MNVYEAFIYYLMSLSVWFFMGEETKKVKVERKDKRKIKAQDELWRRINWKTCLLFNQMAPNDHNNVRIWWDLGDWVVRSVDPSVKCFFRVGLLSDDENFHLPNSEGDEPCWSKWICVMKFNLESN